MTFGEIAKLTDFQIMNILYSQSEKMRKISPKKDVAEDEQPKAEPGSELHRENTIHLWVNHLGWDRERAERIYRETKW